MMDPHEIKAIRRLGAAILAQFATDQVRIFHAAMRGKKSLRLSPNVVAIRDLDVEIRSVRRYMASKDFRDICALAGVEIRVEPAIEHMLRVAEVYAGGLKGVTVDLALRAGRGVTREDKWPAIAADPEKMTEKRQGRASRGSGSGKSTKAAQRRKNEG